MILNVTPSPKIKEQTEKTNAFTVEILCFQQLPEGRARVRDRFVSAASDFLQRTNVKVRIDVDNADVLCAVDIHQRGGVGVALVITAADAEGNKAAHDHLLHISPLLHVSSL
jgi:hypothetical protein